MNELLEAARRHPARVAGLLIFFWLLFSGALGCAHRRPQVDPVQPAPVPVGCGTMPPAPTLCIETLAPDAPPDEVVRCYAETAAQLIADDRALRAQYAPCAK